jgi:hypothetical protein
MTIRLSLLLLATLLGLVVLATLSGTASASAIDPALDAAFEARRILSTGPLNVIVFEISQR